MADSLTVSKVRRLALYQTHDPARGSFLVHLQILKRNKQNGERIYASPAIKTGNGLIEFSNSIHFVPIDERI